MKLVGLMPVRNEAWILGLTARAALQWCDMLAIFNHASTDKSQEIALELMRSNDPGRIGILQEPSQKWDEMQHRQALLETARNWRATHISIIDADELLTANLLPRIRSLVEGTPRGSILQLPLYNLRGSVHRYHVNGVWGKRIVSVAFADDPALHWGGDRFHSREPHGRKLTGFLPIAQGEGGVLHFWGASEKRLHEKHRLYRITERLRWPDKDVRDIERMYSMAEKGMPWAGDTPGTWAYADVQESWYRGYEDLMAKHLDVDAEPWQRAECDRLIELHGHQHFAGLDV
jgi:hypothetical protein